eukprot:SM018836S03915  [mRNA]  locus=s18836:28:102:+ [translate_table: standard]
MCTGLSGPSGSTCWPGLRGVLCPAG